MDIIFINDLRVDTVIGVWEWERRIRQILVMHVEMGVDISFAGETDDLSKTVDYKAVNDRVRSFTSKSEFKLVETLAEKISEMLSASASTSLNLLLRVKSITRSLTAL